MGTVIWTCLLIRVYRVRGRKEMRCRSPMQYPVEDIPISAFILLLDRVNDAVQRWRAEVGTSPFLPLFTKRMDFWDALTSSSTGKDLVTAVGLAQTIFAGGSNVDAGVAAAVSQFQMRQDLGNRHGTDWQTAAERVFKPDGKQMRADTTATPGWYREWIEVNRFYDHLPSAVRGALLLDSWRQYARSSVWFAFGTQIASYFLKAELGSATMPSLHIGLKAVSSTRYNGTDPTARLIAFLHVLEKAVTFELKEHKGLVAAAEARRIHVDNRRITSKLQKLLELSVQCPVISVPTVVGALRVTSVGARDLIRDLNLREITGRKRDCLWNLS